MVIMREYCGLFGICGHKEASTLTYLGLYALQHRGEESCGIVTSNGRRIYQHKAMGTISDVFDKSVLKKLRGDLAIGHVRYSTTGSSTLKNAQPFVINYKRGAIAIAHNGNITNSLELKDALETGGSIIQTGMDSELVLHLLVKAKSQNIKESLIEILPKVKGAYSFLLLAGDTMIGIRDPHGFRPLCIGKVGKSYVLASETCALDLVNAKYVRDVEPGEIVFINGGRIESVKPFPKMRKASCIFEFIYFARPDSNIFTKNVYLTRKRLGKALAKEHPVPGADFIMPIPDSGVYAALGFSEESKRPVEMGMIRNHYIGRSFIQPSQHRRDFAVKVKLNPIRDVLKGKKIAIVEDSIVRGTTSRLRVKALREAGAKEIHMRVSCPPLISPCYYGIDFPTTKELIASKHSIEEIRKFIGVDSLKYISLKGMLNSMMLPKENFCTACFTKDYPEPVNKCFTKKGLETRRNKCLLL
ncbi:MAG: amidophosphoribosyltransferase [Candidatus Omnitrophica bacterium]|nr:amidophosphoribosyltransferase [Candidatus Omnitrophota bacterium]